MRMLCSLVIATASFLLGAGDANATTYYVNSASGNDANNGTSTGSAWQSLTNVNNRNFAPGDNILFSRGSSWQGRLAPCLATRCAGTAASPIKIDAYGTGSAPLFNGAGSAEATIQLVNQSYWEIRNLEVTNTGPQDPFCAGPCYRYVGIQVLCNSTTVQACHHIYIGHNTIHDVNGVLDAPAGNTAWFYGRNAGIAVDSDIHNPVPNYYTDVKIEYNTVYRIDRVGIYVGLWEQLDTDTADSTNAKPKTSSVYIGNNTIYYAGGDGILVYGTSGTTIEYNVVHDCGKSKFYTDAASGASVAIWSAAAVNTTIQNNEVYGETIATGKVVDRQAFDADWGSVSQTVQYNYSHNNYGGFLITYETNKSDATTQSTYIDNQIVRYNISWNDGTSGGSSIFTFCGQSGGVSQMPAGSNPPDINNNTILLDKSMNTSIIGQCASDTTLRVANRVGTECNGYPCALYFYNNIIDWANQSSAASFTANMPGSVFDYNIYHGPLNGSFPDTNGPSPNSNEPHGLLQTVPGFVTPLCTTLPCPPPPNGIAAPTGTKLAAGSPALASGYNSGFLGPHDYWGNSIGAGAPNRGAYNGNGL